MYEQKDVHYFAHARTAGLVLGAKCPIVLVSRADPADAKLTAPGATREIA